MQRLFEVSWGWSRLEAKSDGSHGESEVSHNLVDEPRLIVGHPVGESSSKQSRIGATKRWLSASYSCKALENGRERTHWFSSISLLNSSAVDGGEYEHGSKQPGDKGQAKQAD